MCKAVMDRVCEGINGLMMEVYGDGLDVSSADGAVLHDLHFSPQTLDLFIRLCPCLC